MVLSLIGIILRWGFLICELIFIYCGLFVLILVVFCVVSSFTTFRPNFTSGLLQVILPRPRIGMLSLVTVSPVITAFHSCCLSYHVFDQVNLWSAWVGFNSQIKKPHLKMIPIKDNNKKFGTDPTMEDQIRIYKAKKSILDRPSGLVSQRIEALSLYGSWWALSEDSGFKSFVYCILNLKASHWSSG